MLNHHKSALTEAVLFGRAVTGQLKFSGATEKVSVQGWGLTEPKDSVPWKAGITTQQNEKCLRQERFSPVKPCLIGKGKELQDFPGDERKANVSPVGQLIYFHSKSNPLKFHAQVIKCAVHFCFHNAEFHVKQCICYYLWRILI